MKAEHRKELETNTLADRMGRAVQGVQHQSRRTLLFVVLGVIGSFLVLFLVFRFYQVRRVETSQNWEMLEDGSHRFIEGLIKAAPETNPGKAARFQKAWFYFWELGVKRIGNDPAGALRNLDGAALEYRQLAEDCKGDPVW